MRSIFSLGIILLVTTSGQGLVAQEKAVAPNQSAALADDRPSRMPSRPTSIPFELRDNLVTVAATINGQPQNAVLDSGSGALAIDQSFARKIALEEGKTVGEVAGAGSHVQQLRPVKIPSLKVGPLGFDQADAYSVNLEQLSLSAGFPIHLLIGAPAFKYGAVTIDYRRQRVTYGPSGSAPKCTAPIPMSVVHDIPVVEVEMHATPSSPPARLRLVVELGTRHRVAIIGGPFVRSEAGQALVQAGQTQKIGHGTGGEVQGSVARIAQFRIGSLEIRDVDVALSSGVTAFEAGGLDGSLGVPLWKEGRITFDYPNGTICIEKR